MCVVVFFNDTATTEIYTLSLHDALPISLKNDILAKSCDLKACGAPHGDRAVRGLEKNLRERRYRRVADGQGNGVACDTATRVRHQHGVTARIAVLDVGKVQRRGQGRGIVGDRLAVQ